MKLLTMFQQLWQEFFLQNQIQELYKYEKSLYSFTLQFRSDELETSYQNRQMAKVVVQFRVSIILQILINVGFCINSSIVYNNMDIVKFRSGFIGWMILCLYLQKKSQNHWNFITNLLIFVNSVINVLLFAFFTKFVNPTQSNMQDIVSLSLMSGLQQGLFAMSYFLIQSNYLMQCSTMLSFFLIMMGIFTRFLNYRLWTQYVLLLFTCYLLRQKEKTNRLNFLLIHKSIQNLEACKKLYDETVPTSIIILEENVLLESNRNEILNSVVTQNEGLCSQENRSVNVVYFNKSASFHFETINEIALTQKLSEIEIINTDQQSNKSEKLIDKLQGLHLNLQTELKYANFSSFDYQIMSVKDQMQCQRITKSQTVQYYDASAQGCLWDGKQSIMLILNDTTDRVLRIKHLQELDNYKDNLLATVSHDLKTPLNGLSIIANVVKNSIEKKEKIKKNEILEIIRHMDDMISNQQILLTMINDLIDFIQQKKKGLRLNITHFDLNNCVEQVVQMFKRQMEMKKIIFKVDGLTQKITMFSDQVRLQQILFNLISNAIKFTFQGSITLIITTIEQNNCTLVQFAVQDTGLGIPVHIQNKLFKAYSTYNLGNCNQQGVGLGLIISRSLVGLLGPREYIEMNSKEKEGSTFSFTIYSNAHYNQPNETHCPENDPCSINILPSTQVQQSTRKSRRYQTSIDSLTSKKKQLQVLIVDDTIFNIYALKQLLEKLLIKKEIEEAYNGLEALKKVKQKIYDIIFMDVSMPVMDGLQAIQEIRKHQEKQKITKSTICVLSAFEEKEDANKSLSVGADFHLEKPLKVQALKNMLEQFSFI